MLLWLCGQWLGKLRKDKKSSETCPQILSDVGVSIGQHASPCRTGLRSCGCLRVENIFCRQDDLQNGCHSGIREIERQYLQWSFSCWDSWLSQWTLCIWAILGYGYWEVSRKTEHCSLLSRASHTCIPDGKRILLVGLWGLSYVFDA